MRNSALLFAVTLIALFLPACSRNGTADISTQEITGDVPQRVRGVSAMITRHHAVPTPILDAHFLEEQTGDGRLGPSDFRSFCVVQLSPQDAERWMSILKPLGASATYSAPLEPRDWWVSTDSFASLQFYDPHALTGRVDGWIGVAAQTGQIYIFSFTK